MSGTVVLFTDEPPTAAQERTASTPLKDVQVRLSGGGKEFEATTDALGAFSFSGLPSGKYAITANLSGYRQDWPEPNSITLRANGCFETSMVMKVDRRVQGVIVGRNGDPASGTLVQMISTKTGLKPWERPILLGTSDNTGRYTIDGIPPGEYYLGVNIGNAPTKEYPYPSTYYPGTGDVGEATRIIVDAGVSVRDFDFRVPGKLPLIKIRGRILDANGNPPPAGTHPQVRFKEPDLSGQIEQEVIQVDADGRFTFELCAGVQYSVFAFAGPAREPISSAPVTFTPTEGNSDLVLILDKTVEEFMKLRRSFK